MGVLLAVADGRAPGHGPSGGPSGSGVPERGDRGSAHYPPAFCPVDVTKLPARGAWRELSQSPADRVQRRRVTYVAAESMSSGFASGTPVESLWSDRGGR